MGKYDAAPTVAAGLLRQARDRANITQGELATLAGVTQQVISAYETGRREPTLPTLMRLLGAAGFELRMHLAPVDGHDVSVAAFIGSLPPETRAEIQEEASDRVAAARLRRIRGT